MSASQYRPGDAATTRIASTSARVTDLTEVCRMLDGLHNAGRIRNKLSKRMFARQWHEASERSFWITSDGATASCLTVSGLTADETATLGRSFDERRAHVEFVLSACTLRDMIEAELDVTADLVN
jgi:hypothetical protein